MHSISLFLALLQTIYFSVIPSECDVDKSGHIDAKELHIGLLLFYDKLNAKLPVHMKPPCHDDVKAFLKSHDISQDERLDFQEFSSCVKSMLGMGHRGVFGSLQFQVAKRIAMKMLILPAVVALIKYAAKEGGVKGVGKVPDGVMVIALEGAIKSVKTAAPGLGE